MNNIGHVWNMHLGSLFAFASWLKCAPILAKMCILKCVEHIIFWLRCILECTIGNHIYIYILVAIHTFWRRYALGGTYLY